MAILKIYTFPDSILRIKAKNVVTFDAKLKQLTEDMLETMYDAPGVGLAATQIGESLNLVVLDIEYKIEGDSEINRKYIDKNPLILINPINNFFLFLFLHAFLH